jgi:hypothetical protein
MDRRPRGSIDRGLANSRYGIVVLSKSFLKKQWPQWELDGLVQRQMNGSKVILPLWHGVSGTEIAEYSPSLANIVAARTDLGFGDVFAKMLSILKNDQPQLESLKSGIRAGSKRVIVSPVPEFDDAYSELSRMLRETDGAGIKGLLLDNPHLLQLFVRDRRPVAIQTFVPSRDGHFCDAMALYVPQWTEVAFFKLCSIAQPPIANGVWSVEFAEAVGILAGLKHGSAGAFANIVRHGSAGALADIVREIGETANDDREAPEAFSLRRFAKEMPHKSVFILIAGRMDDKDPIGREQLHAALPGLQLRSYDSLAEDLRSSAPEAKLDTPLQLVSVSLTPMERQTIGVEVRSNNLREITKRLRRTAKLNKNQDIVLMGIRLAAYVGDNPDKDRRYYGYHYGRETFFEMGISEHSRDIRRSSKEWSEWLEVPEDGSLKMLDIWGAGLKLSTVLRIVVDKVAYHVRTLG